jgi:hypothetical protein
MVPGKSPAASPSVEHDPNIIATRKNEHAKPEVLHFEHLEHALATAAYIEQMINTEIQWIGNRMNWFLVAESMLVAGYIGLFGFGPQLRAEKIFSKLTNGVPIVGIICALLIGLAVRAAAHEANKLSDERVNLSEYINSQAHTKIPKIGYTRRDEPWTRICGALPHWLLPLIFVGIWSLLWAYRP